MKLKDMDSKVQELAAQLLAEMVVKNPSPGQPNYNISKSKEMAAEQAEIIRHAFEVLYE